jgi:acetyl esterase/lipase
VDGVVPIASPAEPGAVPLPSGRTPRGQSAEGWAQQAPGQRLAYDVDRPQLVPVPGSLPPNRIAPAVLLVPGGGFLFLSMDNEGFDVARRLDREGVRVFIVKYGTHPVGGFVGFKERIAAVFQRGERVPSEAAGAAVGDVQAAVRLVRARAAEWHVDPAKIGVLGFSAGAVVTLAAVQANAADARPDFVGLIYGPTKGGDIPAHAPPLFAAIAADDRFFKAQDLSLIHGWRQSGASVELHLYSGGGHGFASHPNGTTSDAWFDQFALWLQANGITRR